MENSDIDNIELRSEKVRHIIGKVPPLLVRTGTVVVTLIVIALAIAFYTIRYPITIEVEGRVMPHDTLQIAVSYKYLYLYLFTEPRQVIVTYEGEDRNAQSHVYTITSFSRRLLSIGPDNYFIAKASVASDRGHIQIGQKAEGQIIVSDKTLWQQVFR